jgi:hypothetical protein
VAAPESGAHPDYVHLLLASSGADTVLTEWFGDGWPNAPHRVLRRSMDAAQRSGWREPTPPYRGVGRDAYDMPMYAGMAVGDVTISEPAADIVADLTRLM